MPDAYQPNLPVKPKQLEAIGLVAAEWLKVESVMDAAIWRLADISDEDAGAAITTHLTATARIEILSTLFNVDCDRRFRSDEISADEVERRRAKFKTIQAELAYLKGRRNAVVHAMWVTGAAGSPLTYVVKARGTLQRRKEGLSDGEIRAIAQRMAVLSGKLRSTFGVEEDLWEARRQNAGGISE